MMCVCVFFKEEAASLMYCFFIAFLTSAIVGLLTERLFFFFFLRWRPECDDHTDNFLLLLRKRHSHTGPRYVKKKHPKKPKWLPALLRYILTFVMRMWTVHIHIPLLFFHGLSRTYAPERERKGRLQKKKRSIKCSLLIYNISVSWTCPVLVVLCLLHPPPPPPCTPPCIHSNTHTCTKYVSCCILATGKVITERAKELACCRAADLIRSHRETGRQIFPPCSPTQHLYINAVKCKFFFFLFFCLPSLRLLDSL